jgi:hypothetical protein
LVQNYGEPEMELIEAAVVNREGTAFDPVLGDHLKIRARIISLLEFVHGDEAAAAVATKRISDWMYVSRVPLEIAFWDTDHTGAENILIHNVLLVEIRTRRFAPWGLFVFPAGKDDEFYRIGIWSANTRRMSTEEWERRTITLI